MRRALALLFCLLATAGAACGGSGAPADLDITFTTQPSPPRTGENTFEVVVTDGSQPLTDADVSVELYMAAMPSMNMPEMRSTVALTHEGEGRYRGTGHVAMSGPWDATVTVRRDGQAIGEERIPITAQ